MPVAVIGVLIFTTYNSAHDSYRGPDPSTDHVVEMRTKHGDPYYVTPFEQKFSVLEVPGMILFLAAWSYVARKTRPKKDVTKP